MNLPRFRPRVIPTLATLAVLPVLLALGFWQLDRARQKLEIRQNLIQRSAQPPLKLGEQPLDPQRHGFRRVIVTGVYQPRFQILLDNRVHRGRAGVQVLTPLRIGAFERVILVDRGWLPWGPDRARYPEASVPAGQVTVTGRLVRPSAEYFTLERAQRSDFQTLWQNLDLGRYRAVTGLPVAGLVLEAAPDGADDGKLIRDRPAYRDDWVDRHRGYAFQWFALAGALVLVYLLVNLRRREGDDIEVK